MNKAFASPARVLCVDLDGTLSRTDTLIELLLALAKQNPLSLLLLPFWLVRGKAWFKAEVARRTVFDPATLAYNEELADWLRAERAAGRRIVLASGADLRVARAVAGHHEFFDDIVASDARHNMTGEAKAEALTSRFGHFDYVGNAKADMPVWAAAERAILSANSRDAARKLSKKMDFAQVFEPAAGAARSRVAVWREALRIHQWIKNVLMFVPLLLAHEFLDLQKLVPLLLGFVAFNLCASSVYLLNDLLDLAADRGHPRKRLRPFAAAELPLEHGLVAIPLLLAASFAIALEAGAAFAAVLAFYYVLTLAYSLDLKRRELIDVFTLASLYTLRIVAGAAAASVVISPWLLGFSIFIFLSLAIVKRVAELESGRERGATRLAGRGYRLDDLAMLRSLGVAAGYASVVVLALYVSAPDSRALYPHHQLLWLFAPLVLYWISRIWLVTHRGEMHDDPIVFATRDPQSRIVALLAALVFELAAI